LLGHELEAEVEHQYAVTERHDFVRRVKYRAEVSAPVQKQSGHYGYDVVSVVRIKGADGDERRRNYPSKYWPVPEVYWVPEGFDLSLLPPLPEGAADTVVGEEAGADSSVDPAWEARFGYPEPS
jgi:hypothetical protein